MLPRASAASCLAAVLLCACAERPPARADHDLALSLTSSLEVLGQVGDEGHSAVLRAQGPFVRLGLMWDAPSPDVEGAGLLELRWSTDGVRFGPWARPTVVFSEGQAFAGHLDTPGGPTFFQYRLVNRAQAPSFLFLEDIAELGEPGAVELPTEAPPPAQVGVVRQGLATFPNVLSRAAWGARAPKCSSPTTPYRLVVHHSASPTNDTFTPEARLRQTQAYHMDSRGYCDVAYNYLMSRDARVWMGRGPTTLGGHTLNANGGNLALCVLGNYVGDAPTPQQECALAGWMALLSQNHRIALNGTLIKGHRDYGQTACPGDRLYARLGAIISQAANGCAGAPPPPPPPPPPSPAWGARFVAQSFPAASAAAVVVPLGSAVDGWFELRNTGTQTWSPSLTRLAPTPRDVASVLAAPGWLSPARVTGVEASTPPGAVGRFKVRLAGNALGEVTQTFGLLHEGVSWFSSPGQGGPADTFLAVRVRVVPVEPEEPPPPDAGTPGPIDVGPVDAGSPAEPDAGEPEDPLFEEPAVDAGLPAGASMVRGGCGCSSTEAVLPWALAGLAAVLRRRRAA